MKKNIRLLAALLVMALLLSIAPLTVLAEDTLVASTAGDTPMPAADPLDDPNVGNEAPSDEPATIALNGDVTTILVPLSADNQETTYAVQIKNPVGDPTISTEDDAYINVWKAASGTINCVYVVGHQLGTARFQLDGKTYTVRVVPRNQDYSSTRELKVSASDYDAEHVKMYYSINGSELYEARADKVDIDQTFPGGFNIMIFAAPQDGYALTKLIANQGIGQFYSLAGELEDGSDSNAWPFTDPNANDLTYSFKKDPVDGSEKHGFSALLEQKSMTVDGMRDLFRRAKALGCDGVLTYTRNIGTQGLDVSVSCEVEKLPTMTMAITQYKKADESTFTDYSAENSPVLEIGDTLRYTFTITRSGTQYVDYYEIKLDAIDSLNYVWTCEHENLPEGNNDIVLTWDYTLSNANSEISKYAGGTFTANANLTYAYESRFSKGLTNITNEATANCSISKLLSYKWCDHLPKEIAEKIPLPQVTQLPFGDPFTLPTPTQPAYVVEENGYVVGTYRFICWGYEDAHGAEPIEDHDSSSGTVEKIYFEAGETLTMPNEGSVTFSGHWHYFPAEQYSVTYQWEGLPENLTESTAPGVPTDGNTYYAGQTFPVDGYFQKGDVHSIGQDYYAFQGWYLNDEEVVGPDVKMTKPPEGKEGITLTGKWEKEEKLTLTICVKDCAEVDENQVFLFRVTGVDEDERKRVDVTVSVTGNGSARVFGLRPGKKYTVTELTDWSWRYQPEDNKCTQTITTPADAKKDTEIKVTFQHTRPETHWLDGNGLWSTVWNTVSSTGKSKNREGV